jgi:hypothetical protein
VAPWDGVPPKVPTWTLAGGVEFPTLALNTVALSAEDTERAVRLAMANGITHIDFHPGKERDGVAAVLASGVSPQVPFTVSNPAGATGLAICDYMSLILNRTASDMLRNLFPCSLTF